MDFDRDGHFREDGSLVVKYQRAASPSGKAALFVAKMP